MSNRLTCAIADYTIWVNKQPFLRRFLIKLFNIFSVYIDGYMDGWRAADQIGVDVSDQRIAENSKLLKECRDAFYSLPAQQFDYMMTKNETFSCAIDKLNIKFKEKPYNYKTNTPGVLRWPLPIQTN